MMPSISQAKLDELNQRLERADARVENLRFEKSALETRVRTFDTILGKIVKAANGQPLTEDRNHYGYSMMSDQIYPPRMTDEERQELREKEMRDRIVNLESRLAAVVAVAQFATDHKS